MNPATIAAEQEIAKRRRNGKTALVLWLLLGWLGVHMFYLRRPSDGVFVLAAVMFGWALHPLIPLAVILLTGLTIPVNLAQHNERVEAEAYARFGVEREAAEEPVSD